MTIKIEETKTGYSGYFTGLPGNNGVYSTGKTVSELLKNLAEAYTLYKQIEHGKSTGVKNFNKKK